MADHEGGDDGSSRRAARTWTFLTNHAHVLICVSQDPGIRGRDIADRVGITERAAQGIVSDLVAEGYVTRTRVGRRNHYEVHPELPLRHPIERDHPVADLLALVGHTAGRREG
jgi:hypothetical protein